MKKKKRNLRLRFRDKLRPKFIYANMDRRINGRLVKLGSRIGRRPIQLSPGAVLSAESKSSAWTWIFALAAAAIAAGMIAYTLSR